MAVEIKVIPKDRKSLRKFVQFGIDLYKGNDCYVPPLVSDDVATLSPEKNPAFDFCEAEYFMAFRDGKMKSVVKRKCASGSWILSTMRR